MIKNQNWIKSLAKKILKQEIEEISLSLKNLNDLIERQDDLINLLVKENEDLKEKKEIRKYVFDIEKLSIEDQKTLGKYHDHEVVEVLKKAFKAKADENNDLLVHSQSEKEAKRLMWAMAVRIYDDFVIQLKTLSRLK